MINEIYKRILSSDELILLYLKEFINELSLCKKIINLKNKLEYSENIIYHTNRWENICGEHLHMMNNHNSNFSLIFEDNDYIIIKDYRPIFYNLTGLSYQIISLIHDLIKRRNLYIEDNNDSLGIKLFNNEDRLYSTLGKEIMIKMKN